VWVRIHNYQLVLTQVLLVSVEGTKLHEEGMFELQPTNK